MTITSLLVGSHFRPPAKALLSALPSGLGLLLVPEPENPYDEDAIAVYLDPQTLAELPEANQELLAEALAGTGFDLPSVLEGDESSAYGSCWKLGFVAKSGGKPLQGTDFAGNLDFASGWLEAHGAPPWQPVKAWLGFDSAKGPTVSTAFASLD